MTQEQTGTINGAAVLALVGATGSGKTRLGVTVAQALDGEIVSADSRQVYQGMDIATGKDVAHGAWMLAHGRRTLVIDGIPIHGLDLVRPDQPFSAAQWAAQASLLVADIQDRGKRAIIVGGTGYYLAALSGAIGAVVVPQDAALRRELARLSEREGVEGLWQRLCQVDPHRAATIDRRNPRRLTRAIEIALASPMAMEDRSWLPVTVRQVGLQVSRTVLYERADRRIQAMVPEGLVEETRRLRASYHPDLPAMSGIGYAEVGAYLDGGITLLAALERTRFRTHAYIRRQATWFRKQDVLWLDAEASGLPGRVLALPHMSKRA